MRVVYLAAGAGQMYCGACARDMDMVRGLIARGHDVEVVPLYTPLRIDGEEPVETDAVFLGGINAYLQQTVARVCAMVRWSKWRCRIRCSRATNRVQQPTAPIRTTLQETTQVSHQKGLM